MNVRVILFLVVLLASGCSLLRSRKAVSFFCGCTTSSIPKTPLGDNWFRSHKIRIVSSGKEESFILHVEAHSEQTSFAGVSPYGNRGFLLKITDASIEEENFPYWTPFITPKNLLAIYQLAYWPIDAVRKGLSSCDIKVTEETYPDKVRTFSYKNSIVGRVDYFYDSLGREVVTIPVNEGGQVFFLPLE